MISSIEQKLHTDATPKQTIKLSSTNNNISIPLLYEVGAAGTLYHKRKQFPILNSFDSHYSKIVSEYDQEMPQSQTADNPMAPRGRVAQPSRDTRKTN